MKLRLDVPLRKNLVRAPVDHNMAIHLHELIIFFVMYASPERRKKLMLLTGIQSSYWSIDVGVLRPKLRGFFHL